MDLSGKHNAYGIIRLNFLEKFYSLRDQGSRRFSIKRSRDTILLAQNSLRQEKDHLKNLAVIGHPVAKLATVSIGQFLI
jgi:hypothetical protein